MTIPTWISTYLSPSLGVLLGNIMWFSPLKILLEARRKNDLGDINVVPFGMIFLSSVAWTIYSFIIRDIFIFLANVLGLILGIFFCISALEMLSKSNPTCEEIKAKFVIEYCLIVGTAFWALVSMLCFIVMGSSIEERERAKQYIGYLGCVVTVAFFFSPLSTLREIMKTNDASSLYLPSIIAILINCLNWTFYGTVSLNDPAIWIPNLIGAILAIIQLGFKLTYPSKTDSKSETVPKVVNKSIHYPALHNPMIDDQMLAKLSEYYELKK